MNKSKRLEEDFYQVLKRLTRRLDKAEIVGSANLEKSSNPSIVPNPPQSSLRELSSEILLSTGE